jgi:hypothetical protein
MEDEENTPHEKEPPMTEIEELREQSIHAEEQSLAAFSRAIAIEFVLMNLLQQLNASRLLDGSTFIQRSRAAIPADWNQPTRHAAIDLLGRCATALHPLKDAH